MLVPTERRERGKRNVARGTSTRVDVPGRREGGDGKAMSASTPLGARPADRPNGRDSRCRSRHGVVGVDEQFDPVLRGVLPGKGR